MQTIDAGFRGKTEITVFDSVEEMIEFSEDGVDACENGTRWSEDSGNLYTRRSFIGRKFSNYKDVKDSVHEVWEEGLEVITKLAADLTDDIGKPKSNIRKPLYDEFDGDEVDNDRLRSGQPYWRTTHRENTSAPATMSVFFDTTTGGKAGFEEIMWRGAAALVLTEKLEAAGYRVELWGVCGSNVGFGEGKAGVLAVNLKRTSEPLDVSTLAAAVSGWFFRTVSFTAIIAAAKGREVASGYGRCHTPTQSELDEISRDPNRCYITNVWNQSAAKAVVNDAIKKYQD